MLALYSYGAYWQMLPAETLLKQHPEEIATLTLLK